MTVASTNFCPKTGCILFDLDGTLLDSAIDIAEAGNQLLRSHNQPTLSLAQFRPLTGEGAIKFIEIGFGYLPEATILTQLKQELFSNYENIKHRNSSLFAGVEPMLEEINLAGIPWGIVTNKSTRLTLPLLDIFPIFNTAKALVCADTLSKDKPHPEPILHACATLKRKNTVSLYIGDHERDMQAGTAAGLTTIAALYGYIENIQQTQQWPANYYVQTIAELHTLLRCVIRKR